MMTAKYTVLGSDCSIRVYQSDVANFHYYAGIMLNAFSHLLCSKLCWHNRLVPNQQMVILTLHFLIILPAESDNYNHIHVHLATCVT